MKFRIQRDSEIEVPQNEDIRRITSDVWKSRTAGVKFARKLYTVPIIGSALPQFTDIGPNPGFVWQVIYVNPVVDQATTVGRTNFYFNDTSAVNAVLSVTNINYNSLNLTLNGFIPSGALILHPGEVLVPQLFNVTTPAKSSWNCMLCVVEVPIELEGDLLL